jgi:hypothetical protein
MLALTKNINIFREICKVYKIVDTQNFHYASTHAWSSIAYCNLSLLVSIHDNTRRRDQKAEKTTSWEKRHGDVHLSVRQQQTDSPFLLAFCLYVELWESEGSLLTYL